MVYWMREAELKHGRICMLAVVGWLTVDAGTSRARSTPVLMRSTPTTPCSRRATWASCSLCCRCGIDVDGQRRAGGEGLGERSGRLRAGPPRVLRQPGHEEVHAGGRDDARAARDARLLRALHAVGAARVAHVPVPVVGVVGERWG